MNTSWKLAADLASSSGVGTGHHTLPQIKTVSVIAGPSGESQSIVKPRHMFSRILFFPSWTVGFSLFFLTASCVSCREMTSLLHQCSLKFPPDSRVKIITVCAHHSVRLNWWFITKAVVELNQSGVLFLKAVPEQAEELSRPPSWHGNTESMCVPCWSFNEMKDVYDFIGGILKWSWHFPRQIGSGVKTCCEASDLPHYGPVVPQHGYQHHRRPTIAYWCFESDFWPEGSTDRLHGAWGVCIQSFKSHRINRRSAVPLSLLWDLRLKIY